MVPTCSGNFKAQLVEFLTEALGVTGVTSSGVPGSDSVASGLQSLEEDGGTDADEEAQQEKLVAAAVVEG